MLENSGRAMLKRLRINKLVGQFTQELFLIFFAYGVQPFTAILSQRKIENKQDYLRIIRVGVSIVLLKNQQELAILIYLVSLSCKNNIEVVPCIYSIHQVTMHLLLSHKSNMNNRNYISDEIVHDLRQVSPSSAFKLALSVDCSEQA